MRKRSENSQTAGLQFERYFMPGATLNDKDISVIDVGTLSLPTGDIIVCDPLWDMGSTNVYDQHAAPGIYPVKIAAIKDGGQWFYACVKVEIRDERPAFYEKGRKSKAWQAQGPEGNGYPVDSSLSCITDAGTRDEFTQYWGRTLQKNPSADLYCDLFSQVLEESREIRPDCRIDSSDWANWTVPGTTGNIVLFSSGYGDGNYDCYFGYDEDGDVCGIYLPFIQGILGFRKQ